MTNDYADLRAVVVARQYEATLTHALLHNIDRREAADVLVVAVDAVVRGIGEQGPSDAMVSAQAGQEWAAMVGALRAYQGRGHPSPAHEEEGA